MIGFRQVVPSCSPPATAHPQVVEPQTAGGEGADCWERGRGWRRAWGWGAWPEAGLYSARIVWLRGTCAQRCVKMAVAGVGGCGAMVSKRRPKVAPEERVSPFPSQHWRETVPPYYLAFLALCVLPNSCPSSYFLVNCSPSTPHPHTRVYGFPRCSREDLPAQIPSKGDLYAPNTSQRASIYLVTS